MKGVSIFVLYFFSAIIFMEAIFVSSVFASSNIFARISNNIYFYSKPIDEEVYKLFAVPSSYFVKLTGNAGDTEGKFYSAVYLDIAGYVKKGEVSAVQGTPVSPYASNLNFRVFVPSGTSLRSSPTSSSPFNILVDIPFLENNLVYYGTAVGSEMITQKGNVWYYCKYIMSGSSYYGYVYSALCDLLPEIPLNTESLLPYEGEIFAPPPLVEEVGELVSPTFSNELKAIIVVVVCLPCFLLIYLLFKPTRLAEDGGKKKSKVKRLKRSEYYELDD